MNRDNILKSIYKKVYEDSNKCMVWMGSVNKSGRPQMFIDKRRFGGKMITIFPHIFLYEVEFGEVDARYFDNACGNLRCVNPAHNRARTLQERLSNYEENENGCWNWLGNVSSKTGYGLIGHGGKTYLTHRLSYTFGVGEIPDGLMVLHKCDNRRCINPQHLYVGTHSKNMQDMARSNVLKGERNPKAILTEGDVVTIKSLIQSKLITYAKIADNFGVSRQAIKDIASGRTWAWVK